MSQRGTCANLTGLQTEAGLMFRIFNESRNEALAGGRTGRYFRYVFGEVLLIVIGILIALQIDNWNNERQEEETLNSYLASIARNVSSDIAELRDLRERRSENLLNSTRLGPVLIKTENYEAEELFFFVRSVEGSRRPLRLIPDTSGYDALKNSGVLDRLQGRDIEQLLSDYYNVIGNIQHLEAEYNDAIRPLGQSLLEQQASSEITESWAIFDPTALSPQRFEELQPWFREIVQRPTTNLLFGIQVDTTLILQQYEKAIAMGDVFVQMVESGHKSFEKSGTRHPLHSGPVAGEGNPVMIVDGAIAFDSYFFGFTSSYQFGGEFALDSIERIEDTLLIDYPGSVPGQGITQWAAIWLSVNDVGFERAHRDYSRFDTLRLELKGEAGGERVLVHMKDKDDPDDGSQTDIELVLSDNWQTHDIDLARFETADLDSLYITLGFLFIDQFEPVAFRIRNARFINRKTQ
jgi:hypothetical protein